MGLEDDFRGRKEDWVGRLLPESEIWGVFVEETFDWFAHGDYCFVLVKFRKVLI